MFSLVRFAVSPVSARLRCSYVAWRPSVEWQAHEKRLSWLQRMYCESVWKVQSIPIEQGEVKSVVSGGRQSKGTFRGPECNEVGYDPNPGTQQLQSTPCRASFG